MKITFLFSAILLFIQSQAQQSFYELTAATIEGRQIKFSEFKGKKILIVNTASECGFTGQYEDLEKLYKMYKDSSFVILGFPSNDFGQQEPGSNEEIKEFCQKNYGVTFPVFQKSSMTGNNMNEVYRWLTQKNQNGKADSDVKWNFYKYLVDEQGQLVDVFGSRVKPFDEKIVDWIKK